MAGVQATPNDVLSRSELPLRRLHTSLALALALYTVLVALPRDRAIAQQSSEAIRQVERRLDQVEGQKLGERMARVEAVLEGVRESMDTTNKLLLGVCASLVIMVAERALRGGSGPRLVRPPKFEGCSE
jgi:hypothetical protein